MGPRTATKMPQVPLQPLNQLSVPSWPLTGEAEKEYSSNNTHHPKSVVQSEETEK